jgi:two-component sensor histidine kinase
MSMREAKLLFGPEPTAAAMGRRVLDGLSDGLEPTRLDDARLLLTELIANAIQHGNLDGADLISVVLRRRADAVVVEVADPGDGVPVVVEPGSGNGWGLTLLERLADEWGLEPRPHGGTLAWFRLTHREDQTERRNEGADDARQAAEREEREAVRGAET